MEIRERQRRAIAGSHVTIEGRGCLLEEEPDGPWAGFCPEAGGTAPDLALTVLPDAGPPAPADARSFSTPSWEWWPIDDGGYQVAFTRGSERARPMLVSDRTTGRVTLHAATPPGGPSGLPVVFDPFRPPVDQLLLIHHLAHREGFLLHAAGLSVDGVGIAIPGASGAGKSTLTGLLASAIPEATLLTDERLIVRSRNGSFEAWGTPWMGTERIARNVGAPLRALVFPVKAAGHALAPLPVRETVRRLLGTVACPHFDVERSALVLATLEKLVSSVPAFELRFARDAGVGAVIRDLVRRELRAA